MSNTKIKTVAMNERGVIVIPEEMREDLGLKGKTTLVLIESGDEIIVKKEEDVVRLVTPSEDDAWKRLSEESLRRAWEKDSEKYHDRFLNQVQKVKMKELWDNKEDEAWERA